MPAATTAVIESAPGERAGLASGAINAARQVGSVIGVAVLGALVGKGASDAGGIRLALLIAAGVFLAGAALTAAWVRPERSAGRRRDVRVGVRDRRRR
jgi:MFS transporter, DHA2 family, methylenomycin A resistance protein